MSGLWINKYNPEFEKCYPGLKYLCLAVIEEKRKIQIGELWYFDSVKLRDKYFPNPDDTTSTEFDKTAAKRLKP